VNGRENHEAHATLVGMVAVLVGFKVVTSLLVLVFFPSLETALVVVGLSVMWLLAAGWWAASHARAPARLLRARARRRRLIRQEWRAD
jgi:hypothetical protein